MRRKCFGLNRNKTWCFPEFSSWADLYLLYVNDLPVNSQETKMILFAFDTNILVTAKNENILKHKINSHA